jgi:hypothetical protein
MKRFLAAIAFLLWAPLAFSLPPVNIFTNFDIASTSFVYCDTGDIPAQMSACSTGTAANDGWLPIGGNKDPMIAILTSAISVTGTLEATIEVRYFNDNSTKTTAITIFDFASIDAADGTDDQAIKIIEGAVEMRVGIRINGTDTGTQAVTVVYNAF